MLRELIDLGVIIAAFLALATFTAYNVAAKWWQTRSGTAVFILYTAALLLAGHFVLEAITGTQSDWREALTVWIFAAALGWNLATILWKQHVYRSSDDGEMDR